MFVYFLKVKRIFKLININLYMCVLNFIHLVEKLNTELLLFTIVHLFKYNGQGYISYVHIAVIQYLHVMIFLARTE